MRTIDSPITGLRSLIEAVDLAAQVFDGQVWWRGQRDYSWELSPSAFRNPMYNEHAAILRFQRRVPSRYPSPPDIENRPAWLFLMQHYRLPTRLIDWTESPVIAAFFASEICEAHRNHPGCVLDADGALFALSPYALNLRQLGLCGVAAAHDPEVLRCVAPAFGHSSDSSNKILAVTPSEVDLRLMVQLSVFTVSGSRVPLNRLPASDVFLLKFRVPSDIKGDLRGQLERLGIRQSNIFPDLENLAQEISGVTFRTVQSSVETASPSPLEDHIPYLTSVDSMEPST